MIPLIEFISKDRTLNEEIRQNSGMFRDAVLRVSEVFSNDISVDLFVMPAGLLCSLDGAIVTSPIIACGGADLLASAFYSGCVDYLQTPWSVEEMFLRCRKVLNRSFSIFSWGSVEFSPYEAVSPHGREALSYHEYIILKILTKHKGEIVPREVFQYFFWGLPRGESRVVDMYISLLRKKIKKLIGEGTRGENIIRTVRGKGYAIYDPC